MKLTLPTGYSIVSLGPKINHQPKKKVHVKTLKQLRWVKTPMQKQLRGSQNTIVENKKGKIIDAKTN